jgi:hypothetical protein
MKALKTTLVKVYEGSKTNISNLRQKTGIYFIYEDENLVYVGMSTSDIYRTILRHFQEWNDSKQEKRISYKNKRHRYTYHCSFILIEDEATVRNAELSYILTEKPRDNREKYSQYKYGNGEEVATVDIKLMQRLNRLEPENIFENKELKLSQFIAKKDSDGIRTFTDGLNSYAATLKLEEGEDLQDFEDRADYYLKDKIDNFLNNTKVPKHLQPQTANRILNNVKFNVVPF